jgi:hypothetical protein
VEDVETRHSVIDGWTGAATEGRAFAERSEARDLANMLLVPVNGHSGCVAATPYRSDFGHSIWLRRR